MSNLIPIEQLTTEILIYKQQTAANIIEIGKRLNQVKELLPHGEWGRWLEEKVDFTDRTAQRFMKIANEFPTSMSHLGSGKLFKLLDVPQEERETFIEQNPVDEMTTRELQAAIKAKKEAERKAKEAEHRAFEAEQMQKVLEAANQKRYTRVQELEQELANKEPVVIEKEKIVEVIPLELQEKAAKVDSLSRTIERLQKEKSDLKFQIDSAKTSIDDTMELAAKVDHFTWRINQFLADMGSLAYVGGQYMRTTDYSQLAYEKALANMEKWIREVRESMQGSRYAIKNEGEVIDV